VSYTTQTKQPQWWLQCSFWQSFRHPRQSPTDHGSHCINNTQCQSAHTEHIGSPSLSMSLVIRHQYDNDTERICSSTSSQLNISLQQVNSHSVSSISNNHLWCLEVSGYGREEMLSGNYCWLRIWVNSSV